jgi:ribose transport system permease protein
MTRTAPAGPPALEPAERRRPSFGQVWNRYGILIVLLAMVALMAVIAPNFWSLSNGFNVARAVSINAVLAAGMTLVILTGGIDLSVGSIIGVAGVTSVLLWNSGAPTLVAVLGGVLVGAVAGLLNGLLVAYLALPGRSPTCAARRTPSPTANR